MDLKVTRIPRDVATRWNATYNMLKYCIEHRAPIDKLTGERENDLRSCEMNEDEWKIATQLRDVLKVRGPRASSASALPKRFG